MTYNIGYLSGMTNNTSKKRDEYIFNANLLQVQRTLKELDIDVVALQEIDYGSGRSFMVDQELELSKGGYPNVARAVNWDKKYVPFPHFPITAHFGKVFSGQSILSKFPLKDHERLVLDRVESNPFWRDAFYLDRLAQVVTAEVAGKAVKLINVHTEAFDQPTRKKHLKTVADLFEKYASEYPTILLGDFNSNPDTESLLRDIVLANQHAAYALKDLTQATYPSIDPERRIDFIFYNTNFLEVAEAKVVKEVLDASDHLPVMARFKLK